MAKKILALAVALTMTLVAVSCSQTEKPTAKKPPRTEAPTDKKPKDTRASVKVKIEGFAFKPAEVKARVNDTIDWENLDTVEHSVHADDDSWQSEPLAQGQHFEESFSQPGTYTYHCHIHTTMKAKVIIE